eukprot:g5038.t1
MNKKEKDLEVLYDSQGQPYRFAALFLGHKAKKMKNQEKNAKKTAHRRKRDGNANVHVVDRDRLLSCLQQMMGERTRDDAPEMMHCEAGERGTAEAEETSLENPWEGVDTTLGTIDGGHGGNRLSYRTLVDIGGHVEDVVKVENQHRRQLGAADNATNTTLQLNYLHDL